MAKALDSFIKSTVVAVAASMFAFGTAHAEYPDKPVKVVVGFAPGGTNDILARLIAQKLQEQLRQPFVVENRPGANSIIAADSVARSPADGYTLFVASSGALVFNPALYNKLRYDPIKNFDPIALLGSFPLVVVASPNTPVANLADMKTLAQKSPDHLLTHGTMTSSFQLAAELFSSSSGVKFTHVTYRGTGPTLAALLGDEVQVAFLDIGPLISHIQGGRLKPIAVTTAKRSKALPNVPTVAELGVPGYDVPIWTGLVAPKGLPPEVTKRLNQALTAILKEKDFTDKLAVYGMEPGYVNSSEFKKQIESDITKWTRVAKDAHIKLD
jgi:tripartite-type tricarboxylate transporter receptor subunit TctC